MISNYKVKTQQKPKHKPQLNTCLFKSIKLNSSPLDSTLTSLDSKTSEATMSSMTADLRAVAAAAAAKTSTRSPPMEAVVVNSIIYSKPSFCSIVVDLGGSAVGDVPAIKDKLPKLLNGECPVKTCGLNSPSMALKQFPVGFASACLTGFSSPPPSVAAQQDAQLYRMCTTMNGSINHQISDLCDNLIAMAGFFATDEHDDDDDDLVEFVYDDGHHYSEEEEFNTDDESESEDDDEDEETDTDDDDDIDVGYYNNDDDDCLDADNDTVDFSYGFSSTINPPKIKCDKGKKVRFNTKPTVHVMHTWDYAYRAARKGQWEMYARDRERFRLRVERASLILNPILNREHRQKVYEQRFVNTTFDTNDNDDGQTPVNVNDDVKVKPAVDVNKIENESSHTESKNLYQKKKVKRRKRFCKMGNKHYF